MYVCACTEYRCMLVGMGYMYIDIRSSFISCPVAEYNVCTCTCKCLIKNISMLEAHKPPSYFSAKECICSHSGKYITCAHVNYLFLTSFFLYSIFTIRILLDQCVFVLITVWSIFLTQSIYLHYFHHCPILLCSKYRLNHELICLINGILCDFFLLTCIFLLSQG